MGSGTLKIHSQNILPIIKQWLYSDKDIFVRELISNACDAIAKLKVLRDRGEASSGDEELRIDLSIDKEKKTLTFADRGLGMDAAEIEKYIGEVAFSGAEEFVEKYQSEQEGDQIIGHFGLGFFSAFMVAGKVEIDSLSWKEGASAARWSCDGSADYEIDQGSREERGTTITLHVSDEEYLDEARLRSILQEHCAFLPVPIYLNGSQINKQPPLWTKPASECTEQEYLEFYRALYPMEPDPLFWIHLNVDYPFHLKGILYFPKVQKEFDLKKNSIKLFCNRVFVSDNCKDLIPEYLTVLRGAIDSPDIPLNVSRSMLQMDRTVRQLSGHISKKVADRLVSFSREDRKKYEATWPDLEIIVKLGAMQEDKFYEKVKEGLIWKNLNGEWTTVEEYLERNSAKHDKRLFYTGDERQQPHFMQLYRDKGIEVLYTNPAIDTHMFSFLETKVSGLRCQRIDGAIDDVILDKEKEKTVLDGEGKTEATKLAEFVKGSLAMDGVEVVAKSLATDSTALFVMMDEQQRRMREFMQTGEMGPHQVVVNTNSKLVGAVQKMADKELSAKIVRQLYDQALLSQREMKPEALDAFLARNHAILEQLSGIVG